jgi:ribose/xylose/arabinose/galactoside ABC-type transport system permease subunit
VTGTTDPLEAATGSSGLPPPDTSSRAGLPADFWERWGMPLALFGLIVVFSLTAPAFLAPRNFINILQQSAVTAIAAVGATIVLISASIDISQGAIMATAGIIAVLLIADAGVPDVVAIMLALVVGLLLGSLNGVLAEKVRIPAFIATLGAALVIRGLAFSITGGVSTGLSEDSGDFLKWLGRGFVGPIPVPVVLTALVYVVASIVMRRTAWGVHTYAIGSNERAARIAGIRVERHRIQVFAVAGLLSALAGVVSSGRLASAAPNALTGAEFGIITAVVLGGVSLYGGRGSVVRTWIAAIFLTTLTNGLILLNVPTFYQQITMGLVLLVALSLDRFRSDR